MQNKIEPKKEHSLAADMIRVFAILGVVSIHTLIAVYDRADFQGGTVWWLSSVWNALSRPAIPLFIMLSGFLLLPKKESNNLIVNRILHRLLVPLLSFFIFFQFWNNGHFSYQNLYPGTLLISLITANVGTLYFLLIMMGLYASLPLIREKFLPLSQRQQLLVSVALILGAIFGVLIEYGTGFFFFSNFLLFWVPYLGFFLIGHVLGNSKLSLLHFYIVSAMYILCVIATSLLSNYSLKEIGRGNTFLFPVGALSPYFDFHLSPTIVLMALSLFALVFQFEYQALEKVSFLKLGIQKIAQASFGIYLLHLLVIGFLETYLRFSVDYTSFPLGLYLIVKFLLVFGGAYLLTLIVKKIPFLRKSIGEK